MSFRVVDKLNALGCLFLRRCSYKEVASRAKRAERLSSETERFDFFEVCKIA